MKTSYAASFVKDLKRLRGNPIYQRVKVLAFDTFPTLEGLADIPQLKKMQGANNAYRIRVGDYRIGFTLDGETVTFKRVLHRKDIYRYFP